MGRGIIVDFFKILAQLRILLKILKPQNLFFGLFRWLKSKSGPILTKLETYVHISTLNLCARRQTGRTHTGSLNRFQSFNFGNFFRPNPTFKLFLFFILCVFQDPLSTLEAPLSLVSFYYFLWIFPWKSMCPFCSKVIKKCKISLDEFVLPTSWHTCAKVLLWIFAKF